MVCALDSGGLAGCADAGGWSRAYDSNGPIFRRERMSSTALSRRTMEGWGVSPSSSKLTLMRLEVTQSNPRRWHLEQPASPRSKLSHLTFNFRQARHARPFLATCGSEGRWSADLFRLCTGDELLLFPSTEPFHDGWRAIWAKDGLGWGGGCCC